MPRTFARSEVVAMLGIALGVLGTALLVRGMMRARRYARHGGYGGYGGYGGHGGHGGHGIYGGHGGCGMHSSWHHDPYARHGHRFDRGFGDDGGEHGPMILRGVFERLRTTPGQERAIVEALRELKGAFSKAGDEAKKAAGDIGDAMRGEEFSTESMGNAFAHLDGATETLRTASFATLSKIHDALDATQRRILADFLKRPRGLEDLADAV